METGMVSLKVDETMVSSVIEKQMQAAIVAQLGDQGKLIEHAVRVALSKKVDSDGKISEYTSTNRYDLLEVLATKSIHIAAKESLDEWLQGNRLKIKAAVLKELDTPSRQRSIAVAYADAIEHSLSCEWRMNCDIKFIEKDD